MELNFARLKVSDEDLTITFEGNRTENVDKTRKNKKKKTSKQADEKGIGDLRNNSSPASDPLKTHSGETNGPKDSTIQKRGTEKKSFVSRLRSNTWSPKQFTSPEFDSIGSAQETSKHERRLALGELTYTQLLYLATPHTRSVSPAGWNEKSGLEDNVEFEDFNSILEDERNKLITEKDNPEDPRRIRNSKSKFTNANRKVEREKLRFGDLSSKNMDRDYKAFNEGSDKVMRSCNIKCNFENPLCKNTCERFDGRNNKIDGKSRRYDNTSPRIVISSHRSDDHSLEDPRIEEDHRFENPRIKDGKLKDSGLLNARILDQSFMDERNSVCSRNNGMLFQLPHDECEKKSCSKLSPSCACTRLASSYESLPRVPIGKVNLVQSRVWQRLRDEDRPKSRDRSFTR